MLYIDLSADNECLYAGFTPLSEEVRRNNDMKELMACNTTRLQQMEFITLMRETVEQIEIRGATLIETDAPLKRYTLAIKAAIGPLEGATRDPQRRPETAVAHTKTASGGRPSAASASASRSIGCPRTRTIAKPTRR